MKQIIIFSFLVFILFSCKSPKKVVETKQVLSVADFPYIEKFHDGIRYKQKGELDDALAALDYCLKVRQNDDAIYYALSQIAQQKRDLVKSTEYLEKASIIDPNNTYYTQEVAYLYFEQNKFAEAEKCFKKLVQKQPRNVDWLYGYAECLVKNGKTKEAVDVFNKTEDIMGIIPELTIQKFRLLNSIKKTEEGIAEIQKARKLFPSHPQLLAILIDHYFQTKQEQTAISLLREMEIADPTNGRVHLTLADVNKQQGNIQGYYDQMLKGFECEDVDLDTKMRVLINIHEKNLKISDKDLQLAQKLVEVYPNESKSHSVLGDFYLKKDEELKALASYKEALVYDQSKFPIWNQVLLLEYQNSKFEDLYKDSKDCITYFPNNTNLYLFNGVASNQIKKYNEAIESLQTGVELVVNDNSLKSEFYSQIGEAYFGLKNYEEGKKNYNNALSINSNSTLVLNNYAYQLVLAKKDLDLAEQTIKKAIELAPSQAEYIDTYGMVLFEKQKYTSAQELYEKAYKLNPGDAMIIEHLGDAHFKNGQKEKALEYWKKALEMGATNKNLKTKIDKKEYYEPLY